MRETWASWQTAGGQLLWKNNKKENVAIYILRYQKAKDHNFFFLIITLHKLHNDFGSGSWILKCFKLDIFPGDFLSAQRNVNLAVFIAGYPQIQVIYQRPLYTLTRESALSSFSQDVLGQPRVTVHS